MFDVGEKVFIRTVTYHLVGQIKAREGEWLMLTDASWIADTSERFGKVLADGALSEVEHVGIAYVNLATATDAFPWKHKLPTSSK
jgi:hypothetical protein